MNFPRESCGLFGVFGHRDAARLTYLGLYALQHRGQESAGITVAAGDRLHTHKGMGLAGEVFDERVLESLPGKTAIGHVRYSTTGGSNIKNAQPFAVEWARGSVAVAHNGNLTNSVSLRRRLERDGAIFQTTADSELVVHLLTHARSRDFIRSLTRALAQVEGAYSFLFLTPQQLVAVRDPNGFRPLALGKLDGAYVIGSESCAFDLIQGEFIREIEPGEIVVIDEAGLHSLKPFPKRRPAFCIFEFIYFARPDSRIFGGSVYLTRKRLGEQLAVEHPAPEADLVLPIPDSGNYAALGFARRSALPFELGIVRNHYIGRTFIQPSQFIRDFSVKIKLNPVRELLAGKKAAVVEDSIVRGTTTRARIRTLRRAGVKEVHLRISCPPHRFPCFYGIDFPTRKELVGAVHPVEEIRRRLGLDSLGYLSREGMLRAMPVPGENFCAACFTGEYPLLPEKKFSKHIFERD